MTRLQSGSARATGRPNQWSRFRWSDVAGVQWRGRNSYRPV